MAELLPEWAKGLGPHLGLWAREQSEYDVGSILSALGALDDSDMERLVAEVIVYIEAAGVLKGEATGETEPDDETLEIERLAALVEWGEAVTFPNGVTIDKRPLTGATQVWGYSCASCGAWVPNGQLHLH